MSWQPIETAPKDGTIVRLRCETRPDFSEPIMYWDKRRKRWAGFAYAIARRYRTFWDPELPQPTHWCPLPPAPQEDVK